MIKETEYTAYDFLSKYYEFKGLVPNNDEWSVESLSDNPPRLYRFLELQSLMKAFNLGDNLIKDFAHQGFLTKRSTADFKPIIKDIEDYAMNDELEKSLKQFKSYRKYQGDMVYNYFFRFSEAMRNMLNFNSGVLEAGLVESRYFIRKTQHVLNTIDISKLKEIEDLIVLIIDPKKQTFTKGELVNKYEFPDVDLQSIDSDWY